ncbi:MAG: MFS transporter [Sulfolobales archaeon]
MSIGSKLVNLFQRLLRIERATALLSLTAVAGVLGNSMWVLYIPLILAERGLTPYLQGILYTASSISTLILGTFIGIFIDSFGYKRSLVLGNMLIALPPLILSLTKDPMVSAIAIYIFYSFGQPISTMSWRSYIMEVSRERAGVNLGLYYSVTGLAALAGVLIGGFIASALSFTHVLIIASILAFITVLLRIAFLEEPLKRVSGGYNARSSRDGNKGFIRIYTRNFRELLRLYRSSPVLKALLVVTPLNGLAVLSPGSYIVALYLSEYMGISTIVIAFIFFLRTVVENQAALLYGVIADRLGPLRSVVASWALSSAMQLVMIATASDLIAIPSYLLWVSMIKLAEVSTASLIARSLESGMKASALASMGTLSGLALIPSPMIQAIAFERDPRLPFIISAVSSILSTIILIKLVGIARK